MRAEFFVEGRPVPKARPRVTRMGTYTPATTVAWERAVAVAFNKSCKGIYFDCDVPLTFYAEVVCPGKGSTSSIRGDADNYAKAVKDALNGEAYDDDIQIVDSRTVKRRARKGEPCGILVRVENQ